MGSQRVRHDREGKKKNNPDEPDICLLWTGTHATEHFQRKPTTTQGLSLSLIPWQISPHSCNFSHAFSYILQQTLLALYKLLLLRMFFPQTLSLIDTHLAIKPQLNDNTDQQLIFTEYVLCAGEFYINQFNLLSILRRRWCYRLHFTDEKIKDRRGQVTYLSHTRREC